MWKLLLVLCISGISAKLDVEDKDAMDSSGEEDSVEHIGASVAQVYQFPFAAALLLNNSYICSAVVLNKFWLLTLSKCLEAQPELLSSYVEHKNLDNITIRTGSSYNNKGGGIYQVKTIINNFDYHVTALKVEKALEYSSQLQNVRLPESDEEVSLGYLASIVAWTPNGHMRVVNAPVIEPAICEKNAKMLPGHYICIGGVQDPDRHFCRRDNGGAVIQNNTLIAISSFINTCALYSKTHAFPKAATFTRWLDAIIWDEDTKPTTTELTTTTLISTSPSTKSQSNATEGINNAPYYADPSRYMLTLPFDPINVPLEPAEDNSVLPRMSLYESYLQSLNKARQGQSEKTVPTTTAVMTSTKKGSPKSAMQMYRMIPKKYDFEYN